MTAKHAPGPWATEWIREALRCAHSKATPWAGLADTADMYRPGPDDAQAIAAVPDTLSALADIAHQRCLDSCDGGGPYGGGCECARQIARDALAKAGVEP